MKRKPKRRRLRKMVDSALLNLFFPAEVVLGVRVHAIMNSKADLSLRPLYYAKVRRALECIATHDPRRFARLQRDILRIQVSDYEGHHYDAELRMIALHWKHIASSSAEENALTLVHEATHARHRSRGIGYGPELRARCEASCVKHEILFARRLADGDSLIERLSKKLETPWWTNEKLAERKLQELRDLDAPRWMIRLARWRMKRRIPGLKDIE